MSRRESNPPQGKRGTRIDFSSALLAPYKLPKDVFNAFPSANNDILEASNCLALERGTATVMHLMRVAEVGLKALASTLGVTRQNDWGSYLREIDKALDARVKTTGKRNPGGTILCGGPRDT